MNARARARALRPPRPDKIYMYNKTGMIFIIFSSTPLVASTYTCARVNARYRHRAASNVRGRLNFTDLLTPPTLERRPMDASQRENPPPLVAFYPCSHSGCGGCGLRRRDRQSPDNGQPLTSPVALDTHPSARVIVHMT